MDAEPLRARLRYVAGWAVVAAALGAGLSFGTDPLLAVVKPWLFGFRPWWVSVAGQPFLGPHSLAGWLAAGLLVAAGVGLVGALGRGRRRWFRIAGGVAGAAAVGLLGIGVVEVVRFGNVFGGNTAAPWPTLGGLAATAIAGALVAFGRLGDAPPSRAWRWAPLPVALVLAVALGYPTLADAWRWCRPQELRALHAEMIRARRAYDAEILSGPSPDAVAANGAHYVLDRRDTWKLGPGDVVRVIWFPDGGTNGRAALGLRVRLGLEGALARRSERGVRQYGSWDSDALFVDGRLYVVASYGGVLLDGRMSIGAGDDDADIRALYAALTGEQAP